jgi:hypothetical protein
METTLEELISLLESVKVLGLRSTLNAGDCPLSQIVREIQLDMLCNVEVVSKAAKLTTLLTTGTLRSREPLALLIQEINGDP